MQPSPRPPSAPPAHPVAPEISRGYGWLVLGGALVWAALVALVLIAFGSLLSSLVLAVGEVKTPTPDGERRAEIAGAVGLATGIGALVMLVLSLVLDLAAAVASIGRLDGRRRSEERRVGREGRARWEWIELAQNVSMVPVLMYACIMAVYHVDMSI